MRDREPRLSRSAHQTRGEALERALAILVVVLGTLAVAAPVHAQEPARIPRIGVLGSGSAATSQHVTEPLRQTLHELGYVEGQGVVLEYRWAEGRLDRLPGLAAELVRLKVDVILTGGTPPTRAARQATGTIPIVVYGAGDLVAAGLAASLARPGGNVTGNIDLSADLSGKRLQLLKEAVPKATRVVILGDPPTPPATRNPQVTESDNAARSMGIHLQLVEVSGPEQFESAFAAIARERAQALVIMQTSFTTFHRRRLLDLAIRHRLPMVCPAPEFAPDGCLMTYGGDRVDAIRRAVGLVDRILKGANPADLPIERPRKFHLAVNLRTAKAIGISLPQAIVQRAEQVIR